MGFLYSKYSLLSGFHEEMWEVEEEEMHCGGAVLRRRSLRKKVDILEENLEMELVIICLEKEMFLIFLLRNYFKQAMMFGETDLSKKYNLTQDALTESL